LLVNKYPETSKPCLVQPDLRHAQHEQTLQELECQCILHRSKHCCRFIQKTLQVTTNTHHTRD